MKKLIKIADLYGISGRYLDAAIAYYEGIYCGFNPPEFPVLGKETWFSPATAPLWLKAAQNLLYADLKPWALHALLMALASEPGSIDTIKALVYSMQQTDHKPAPPAEPDRNVLLEIAQLYTSLKLYSRSLEVLQQIENLTGENLSKRKKEINDNWSSILNAYSSGREKTAFLFGMKLYDQSDKMKIKAPYFQFQVEK